MRNPLPSFIHRTMCLLIPAFFFLFSSCNGKKEIQPPEGMCAVDLIRYGKPFLLFVPDTTANPLNITEEASGALVIKAGKSFAISIFEEKADLSLKQEDLKTDEVNKFTAYLHEDPNAIFWESSITEPEYHFLINQTIGARDFSFQDVQDPENKLLSKAAVQKMFESCRSIVESPKME